ncbi:V-type ATP synthase subunit E [candidate division KSB1 bacterium]|nr:V-type ATP synthase subunit E [candidate division KSB1 bacterium]
MIETGKNAIINSIQQDAQKEADEIVQKAKKMAAERLAFLDKQQKNIYAEAEKRANDQAEILKTRISAGMKVEQKRKALSVRSEILTKTLDVVFKEFKDRMQKPDYADYLLNWIVEAAIGLDSEKASVNVSERERHFITPKLLKKAEDTVRKMSGKTVFLQLSGSAPLDKQGVVLTSMDGRTAFDNRIHTRIKRNEREIQNIIYEMYNLTGERA